MGIAKWCACALRKAGPRLEIALRWHVGHGAKLEGENGSSVVFVILLYKDCPPELQIAPCERIGCGSTFACVVQRIEPSIEIVAEGDSFPCACTGVLCFAVSAKGFQAFHVLGRVLVPGSGFARHWVWYHDVSGRGCDIIGIFMGYCGSGVQYSPERLRPDWQYGGDPPPL